MEAYARHDALLRAAITSQGGVVYKVIGDALQVAFPTAPDAVAAALRAQQGLQAEPWNLPTRDQLPTGAILRDLGAYQLKDLLEPEPIFQLGHPDLPDEFPPLVTLTTRSHNLPPPDVDRTVFGDRIRHLPR